jgi:hypothetical protein
LKEEIEKRFAELLERGQSLLREVSPRDAYATFISDEDLPACQAWIASAANLVHTVATPSSIYLKECSEIMGDQNMKGGGFVPIIVLRRMFGLLDSAGGVFCGKSNT